MRSHIYTASGVLFLSLMVGRYFSVVMMTIGVSRSTIILRMAVRDHGRWCGCQRSWEVIMYNDRGKWLAIASSCLLTLQVTRCGPWLLVVIACKTRFTLIDHPDDLYPDGSCWLSGCVVGTIRVSTLCQRRLLFLG